MEDIEKYIKEMDYLVDDKKTFLESFKTACPPHLKNLWKHLFNHIRPKEEADIIRKHCHLYALQKGIAGPRSFEYSSDSIKERNKLKHDLSLKLKQYDVLKRGLEERLMKIDVSRIQQVEDEEIKKNIVNKSHLLKKKKQQVEREISGLEKFTKKLRIMKSPIEVLFDCAPQATDWERRIHISCRSKKLNSEIEELKKELSILLVSNIPKSLSKSHFNDLILMEKFLFAKVKLLVKKKEEEAETLKEIEQIKRNILQVWPEFSFEVMYDLEESLNNKITLDVKLFEHNKNKPVMIHFQHENLCRLQQLNDAKALDIRKRWSYSHIFLSNIISAEMELLQSITTESLPSIVDILKDSIQEEVNIFLHSPTFQSEHRDHYSELPACQTTTSFLINLSTDLKTSYMLSKIEENLRNYQPPEFDTVKCCDNLNSKNEETKELFFKRMEDNEKFKIDVQLRIERLKKAVNFWRYEPLNEALTGFELQGRDIRYWLSQYMKLKTRLKHEERVKLIILSQHNQSISSDQSSI